MSTKPFKRTISDEEHEVNLVKETEVKPFKIKSDEDIDTSNFIELEEEIIYNNNESLNSFSSKINFFSTIGGVVTSIFIFVFAIVIADTVETVNKIIADNTLSNYIYLGGILFLLIVLILNIISNLKQIKFIKNVNKIKSQFNQQEKNPTKEIIPLANVLLDFYSKSDDKDIQDRIKYIKNEINISPVYQEIYDDLDSKLLLILDKKAEQIIHKASIQAALSTAISPFPIVDMFLIVWRSIYLTKEISLIYGFRPGGLATILLLKQAVVNVAFAGITELASEFSTEITGTTVFAKVSKSSGQGIANGILLARLGYGILEACRPIERKKIRGSFLKSFLVSISKIFISNEKK